MPSYLNRSAEFLVIAAKKKYQTSRVSLQSGLSNASFLLHLHLSHEILKIEKVCVSHYESGTEILAMK